jgi:methylmalonyl-CoA mutase cobalamin-binding subunit
MRETYEADSVDRMLRDAGFVVHHSGLIEPSMEDVFMGLIDEEMRG